MPKQFKPKTKKEPLDTVYISLSAKAWIKEQSIIHNVSMVAIIDEMVSVCEDGMQKGRPNALRPEK